MDPDKYLHSLDLWLQIFIQRNDDTKIKIKLMSISNSINEAVKINKKDLQKSNKAEFEGLYHTYRDFQLIADDSEEGIDLANYYYTMYESAKIFNIKYKI